MKALPVQEILNAGAGVDFGSILIDDKSMDVDVLTGILEGKNHKVPLIIGSNDNEGGFHYHAPHMLGGQVPIMIAAGSPSFQQYLPANTTEKYEGFVREMFGSDADKLLSFYPADKVSLVFVYC